MTKEKNHRYVLYKSKNKKKQKHLKNGIQKDFVVKNKQTNKSKVQDNYEKCSNNMMKRDKL